VEEPLPIGEWRILRENNDFEVELNETGAPLRVGIGRPEGEGDGTVPASSGRALGGVPVADIDHEPAYKNKYDATKDLTEKWILEILEASL
jgi:hypothetical protein